MIELEQKVIVSTSDDEAILCQVTLIYSPTLVRVVPLNRKGELLVEKGFAVLVEDITPIH